MALIGNEPSVTTIENTMTAMAADGSSIGAARRVGAPPRTSAARRCRREKPIAEGGQRLGLRVAEAVLAVGRHRSVPDGKKVTSEAAASTRSRRGSTTARPSQC
jgi:hypothetical protein